jgi:hypothetical protein
MACFRNSELTSPDLQALVQAFVLPKYGKIELRQGCRVVSFLRLQS